MIRYIFLFLLLKSILFGCSLCSVYTPKTHISTQIKADKEQIKSLKINWQFAQEFTKELMQIYDLNLNTKFDENELKMIEDALLNYLEPKNFLTKISYDNKINEVSDKFVVKDYKMKFKDSILSFEYNIDLNYKIYDKNILNINIFDNEGYFFIIFEDIKQLFNIPYKITKQTNLNDVSFIIDAPNLSIQEEKIIPIEQPIIKEEVEKEVIQKENIVVSKEKSILDKFTQNIKKYLLEIEKGEDKLALIFLLMASFLYGVVHSLGPGHGKALAFSYFSSKKSSYLQAFIISLATAFIHIVGALILVLISFFLFESLLNGFIENSISYITSFCAIIIMILAVYILYKKLTKKSSACCSCNIELQKASFTTNVQNINYVKTNINKPVLIQKRSKKEDLIFVLTAGIIPCPGTVLLFVYAFLLKTYYSVILASISISLGMATVIFASSFLGVSLHY
ncbi:MAG: DUF1007 family protein [Aliarcobacter sp.]